MPRKKKITSASSNPDALAGKKITGQRPTENQRADREQADQPQVDRDDILPEDVVPEDIQPIAEDEFLDKEEPEAEEPNPAAVNEDWADLALEDPLEALTPSIANIELSEDPVRLYLKEIGQINLLDADSEFRLAARIEGRPAY